MPAVLVRGSREAGLRGEVIPTGPASTCPSCLRQALFAPRPVETRGRDPGRYAARPRRGPTPSDRLRGPLHAAAPLRAAQQVPRSAPGPRLTSMSSAPHRERRRVRMR